MSCRSVRQKLSDYLDDRLDEAQRQEVEEHLHSCPKCAAEHANLDALSQVVGQLPEEEPSHKYWDSFRQRVESRVAVPQLVEPPKAQRRIPVLAVALSAVGAAAAGVLATVAYFLSQPLPRPQVIVREVIREQTTAGPQQVAVAPPAEAVPPAPAAPTTAEEPAAAGSAEKSRASRRSSRRPAAAVARATTSAAAPSPAPRKVVRRSGGKGHDELDRLLDSSSGVGGGARPQRAASGGAAPAAGTKETLSRTEVRQGVSRGRKRVAKCSSLGTGTVMVQFTIGGKGQVVAAKATGSHAATPLGNCVATAVKSFTFPRFSGDPITINYPFIIQPR